MATFSLRRERIVSQPTTPCVDVLRLSGEIVSHRIVAPAWPPRARSASRPSVEHKQLALAQKQLALALSPAFAKGMRVARPSSASLPTKPSALHPHLPSAGFASSGASTQRQRAPAACRTSSRYAHFAQPIFRPPEPTPPNGGGADALLGSPFSARTPRSPARSPRSPGGYGAGFSMRAFMPGEAALTIEARSIARHAGATRNGAQWARTAGSRPAVRAAGDSPAAVLAVNGQSAGLALRPQSAAGRLSQSMRARSPPRDAYEVLFSPALRPDPYVCANGPSSRPHSAAAARLCAISAAGAAGSAGSAVGHADCAGGDGATAPSARHQHARVGGHPAPSLADAYARAPLARCHVTLAIGTDDARVHAMILVDQIE
ncbi:hypothetical protein KFE25_000433 [Diacronema lutheri]|uniref:Uncharacterized protein n=1 Tax=Diacronema lutheri TaxID=2081491 RepID=A0A8J5XRL5_DIALT|nr:hypothetical protein KFE25_000433 [Diacronema lutheri]